MASGPIAWQLLTGGLAVRVRLDPEQVEDFVSARLGTQVEDLDLRLLHGRIQITGAVDSPLGALPFEMVMEPASAGGQMALKPLAVNLAGRDLPVALAKRLVGRFSGPSGVSTCLTGGGAAVTRIVSAQVDATGLSLTVRPRTPSPRFGTLLSIRHHRSWYMRNRGDERRDRTLRSALDYACPAPSPISSPVRAMGKASVEEIAEYLGSGPRHRSR